MIVFSLKCANEHVFEDWFSSNAAFEELAAKGKIACPECHSHKVEKAPMAPAIGAGKSAAPAACPMAQTEACSNACGCFPH